MKIIKKLSILFALLITATTAFAVNGFTPKCTTGKFNIAVVNNIKRDCMKDKASKKWSYCLYYGEYNDDTFRPPKCRDFDDVSVTLQNQTNNSASATQVPHHAEMTYCVGYAKNGKNGEDMHIPEGHLKLSFDSGKISDNCAQVFFNNDVSCTITKSGDNAHPLYILTINQNS